MNANTHSFDIIGDIHGCISELNLLLDKINFHDQNYNRTLIFLGDLTDRGPDSFSTLKTVKSLVDNKKVFCVRGNHDDKLARCLAGHNVKRNHGLNETMNQLEANMDESGLQSLKQWLFDLPLYLVLDKLVLAHGGMPIRYIGRDPLDRKGLTHCLYGETNGTKDADGFPVRTFNWCHDYQNDMMCVYGHIPVPEPKRIYNTLDVDTGCTFGHKLTCLRYPEMEFVQVPAFGQYAERKGTLLNV